MNEACGENQKSMDSETRRAIVKWIVQSALGLVGYGVILFLAAGRLDWIWGWLFLLLLGAFLAGHPLLLIRRDQALLADRSQGLRAAGVKGWDRRLMTVAGVLMFATWVTAGFDLRFGWSKPVSLSLHLIGLLLNVAGYALFLWALASNPFFSEGVRIQTERGHTVARGGPYRFVRHPGYSGAIAGNLAIPLLLGSYVALIPAVLFGLSYGVRTLLEDRTLQAELLGYLDFTEQTRFRLIPGLW